MGTAADIRIERLSADHARDGFDSGERALDEYLRAFALQNQAACFGVTYVAVSGTDVVGYVTVASSQIERSELTDALARRLPRYPLPTMTIARLATDVRWRGLGVGAALLRFALSEALRMAREFGCVGVRLESKPDAVGFYEMHGFVRLSRGEAGPSGERATTSMFLPLNQIEDAVR